MTKKLFLLLPLFFFFISCSKTVSIDDLLAKEGIALDPITNEPFTGQAKLDFYDGGLKMKGDYLEGVKVGQWKYYIKGLANRYYNIDFKNGSIISVNYNEGNQQWSGSPVEHSADSLMADGKYLVQDQGLYNYNLPPKVFVQLASNNPQGRLTRWFENGQIYSDGSFVNGQRDGEFKWFYLSGAKKEASYWNKGKQSAKTTQWYENGKKYAEASYKEGLLSGKLVWWYEDGQKKEEASFIKGDRDGYAYWWYPNGAKKAVADISKNSGKINLFSTSGSFDTRYDVKDSKIFCSSGEILFNIEKVSSNEPLPVDDGTCDCADCSDEPTG